jgi:hypothetical protein
MRRYLRVLATLSVVVLLCVGCGATAVARGPATVENADTVASASVANDPACGLIDLATLKRDFTHNIAGPYATKSQAAGGAACEYSDINQGVLVDVELCSDMTARAFDSEAFFKVPLPAEWRHPVQRVGNQTLAWLLSLSGAAIVAFRSGKVVSVISVAIALKQVAAQGIFSDAISLAKVAEKKIASR